MQEEETAFDWGHWIFSEACFLDTDVVLVCGSSSFSEGSFTSLQFDNFSCISYPKKTLSQQNKIELNQPTISQDEVVSDHSSRETKLYPAALSVVAEEQVSHCEQLKNAEVVSSDIALFEFIDYAPKCGQYTFFSEDYNFELVIIF